MRDVYVAGVGMTAFGRHRDRGLKSLSEEAVRAALADAETDPGRVQAVYFGNAMGGLVTGQEMVRAQAALRRTGLLGVPVVNVENACASSSTAFHLGWLAVAAGAADTVVVVGTEKMTSPDRDRAKHALASAADLDELAELEARVGGADESRSFFMDLYAETARRYMEASGATVTDFAAVVVKNRRHGAANPHAQFREAVTVEQVLHSRAIVPPLTLFMCSAIGDGSAAVVLTSRDRLPAGRPRIRVAASVLTSGYGRKETGPQDMASRRAAFRAYEIAGVGPEDVDLLELHDAAAPAELVLYEELGLCGPGEGPRLLRSGETALGGRRPVNPSGGLLAKGHPVGATGCAQLTELADQLWGRAGARQVENARIALAENGGGYIGSDSAAVSVTLLERE